MHYYQFHIGDYLTKTRHLSLIEDLAYRRLLDTYFTEEKPLPADAARCARLIAMPEHVESVGIVLNEFFTLSDDGWMNKRCDDEINKYHNKAESARNANAKRWQSKTDLKTYLKSDADQIVTNNHEPITNNHKPIKKEKIKKEKSHDECLKPENVSQETWDAFVTHRKNKKAAISDLVIKLIEKRALSIDWTLEDALKEMIVRGWQGFNPEWVEKRQTIFDKRKEFFDRAANRFLNLEKQGNGKQIVNNEVIKMISG